MPAAKAVAAGRMVQFLRTPPAQGAGEPPSKPAQVWPRSLKGNRVFVMARARASVRCRVIQMHHGTAHVSGVNLEPDAKDGAARTGAPFVENIVPHPSRCVDHKALFNTRLLPVPSPPAATRAAHCDSSL